MKVLRSILIIVLFAPHISAGPAGSDFSAARNNNVCKDLRDDVLLYFVFIDTRTTYPWSEFDILTTIDSIQIARQWIESQAADANIPLKVKTDYYIGNEYATINRNLPKKSVYESVTEPNFKKGTAALSRWADYVSKIIGESLYIKDKDGIPSQKKPGNKERLVAYLRDEYNVESVALMFFVNNYFKNDISIAVNTEHTEDIEFAVVSYKYPSEIIHNFLHLFGAADLYKTEQRRNSRRIKLAGDYFPNDIMRDPYARSINDLNIGDFTRYMIGWKDDLEEEYKIFLTDGLF